MVARTHDRPFRGDFDLIVIGAGINGAGIARDAAMRGLKVLLLDKGDLGSGTSSWSTRLIHGGLRYLEHGEIGLVRESLREREILFHIAPHLVKALPMLIPLYQGASRGRWTIRAGMLAYDALSIGKSLPRHRMLTSSEALELAPGLDAEGLLGAALYFDGQVEFAERLVLENALAAKEFGATIATYSRVDELIVEERAVLGVAFTDLKSNETGIATAKLTINASGPWVDRLASGMGAERMIGGTKGSHIVVAPFAGAPASGLYIEARMDRRPFFIIPWNSNYLIGTTDIRFESDPGEAMIDAHEIDYLLAETNRIIPNAQLTREVILFSYSGVRPLAYASGKRERSLTRRHFINDHAPHINGFVSIVGGKLTTYRHLAAQAVDLVFRKLGRRAPPCATHEVPLPGAVAPDFESFSRAFAEESKLPASVSKRLLRIYGTRAPSVLKLAVEDPRLAKRLGKETDAVAAEVVFSFQHEMAQSLTDCLLRRMMVGFDASLGIGVDEAAAQIAQQHLGWTSERAESEVLDYRSYVERLRPISQKQIA
jgi:glycerol-3-phosphate dehydrogenase